MSVTIAIPIFNAGEHLKSSITSVLSQTYTDFELLLVDDGSTDNSLAIALEFKDPRIRIISDGENKGLPHRLNQIVNEAKYNLIARMDADDFITKNRIELQVNYLLENPNIDLVSMGMVYFEGKEYYGHVLPNNSDKEITLSTVKKGKSGICHATLLVRKSWYQRNLYDSSMVRIEDFELWLRAYKNNDLKVGFINEVGYFYRSDNTLTYNKYVKVYRSLILYFLGVYGLSNFDFKLFSSNFLKFILISFIFLLRLEGRLLSMKNRTTRTKSMKKLFDINFSALNEEEDN